MVALKTSPSDYSRTVAKEPRIYLRNRYFEENPVDSPQGTSLIARPGRRWYQDVGTGPIRAVFEAPGAFDELFVVSGLFLYSIDPITDTATNLGQISNDDTGSPSLAATAAIGAGTPPHLYVCDGTVLYCYTKNGYAKGHLTATAVANNDTVEINGTYYKFTSGSVDTGTPAGTSGAPWLVKLGATAADSIDALAKAINDSGTNGTDYSTLVVAHTTVTAYNWSGGDLSVNAKVSGVAGNGYTTTETGAGTSWGGSTLSGGGTASLLQIRTPDEVGAISVAHINSFIIVVPRQNVDINGRFYYINPGNITIDPLDYATAERSPDPILQCLVFSDQIWFCGETTAEVWITTGNVDLPFQRFSGMLFDRGVVQGTAVQVKDTLMFVDNDGAVFMAKGGLKKVSRPDIEERIRLSIQALLAS